jgi:hypothetical protein
LEEIMKRVLTIVLTALMFVTISVGAKSKSKKVYPMMIGPKITVGLFEGDDSFYPIYISGDMLLNLYKNYLWLRLDPVSLVINEQSDQFSINMGSPLDVVFMGRYGDWRPYGFGGLGLSVTSAGEDISTLTLFDAGGGISYEASRGLHVFGEAGVDLGYNSALPDDQFYYRLFLSLGARFAFIW